MLLQPDSEIALTGGSFFPQHEYRIDHSQDIDSVNGASSRFYELWNVADASFNSSSVWGFQIQYVLDNGVIKNRLVINSSGNTLPGFASVNSTTATPNVTDFWVEVGDVVRGFIELNSTSYFYQFTCFEEMLYRTDGNDYHTSIEFDLASNSMKYVMGGNFETAINSGSSQGAWVRRQSFGGLVSIYWFSHVQGTQTIGYVSRDGYTGTWTVHHPSSNANVLSWVIVGTAADESSDDPPENDPPPTPVFIRGSARRGNLNFW